MSLSNTLSYPVMPSNTSGAITAPTNGPHAFKIVNMPVDMVRYWGLNQRDDMTVPEASAHGPGKEWNTADN